MIAPWQHPELERSLGLTPPKRVLISGPAGSGKSVLAGALAAELGANFLPLSGQELFSQWFGQSEAALRHVFNVATKVSPAVIVIDPIDALAPARGSDATSAQSRVRDQLIAELDAIGPALPLLVVGVTQSPERLDPSLLQPERFGFHLALGLPDERACQAILRHAIGEAAWSRDAASFGRAAEDISTASEGWAGSALRELVVSARRRALGDALARLESGEGAAAQLAVEHLWGAWLAAEEAARPGEVGGASSDDAASVEIPTRLEP